MAEQKHIQKTLTPIKLTEGMSGYDTVKDIEEKLNDPEVFNIAIAGPYGSGKSTVLKSLREDYAKNHTYLTISLASLTGEEEKDDDKRLEAGEMQKVEYSILQQLIYTEKPETLPGSRFRRINGRSIGKSVGFAIAAILFFVAFLIVFEPAWIRVESLCKFFDLGKSWNLFFDCLGALYMLGCVGYLAAYLYKRPGMLRVRALNVKNLSIELSQDSSVFNKHLDEIVYFFESTDYDVVIIEDLDRFRCPEIFQKLREINFLLRQSKVLKGQGRRVRFIYAVKDDLFKDAERTKFFDYIATVTPVVNPKNSCEKLTQELTERGYSLKKDALLELSEFVDDMRMLKNVANEFQQYMERLTASSTPDLERLLAMIIYKNHHPDDFGQLHYKKGKVYEFIRQKSEWTQIAVDKVIKPRMEVWQKKRDEVLSSQRMTLKQWRALYMGLYREVLSSSLTTIIIDGTGHTISDFIKNQELFEKLISQKKVHYREQGYYNGQTRTDSTEVDFAELEKKVDDRIGYQKRKELAETSTTEIDTEILKLREEETRLRNYKLAKLLVKFPEIKEDERYTKIGLTPLMENFLQRGYIDETYYDYLTIYDGTTMSLKDRELLSRIKQNSTHVSYDEEIDDVAAFVDEIPLFVYEYKSVLNYQIADELESHPVLRKDALLSFEKLFTASAMPPLDFLANYYKRGTSGAEQLWRRYVKSDMSWQHIQTYEKREYWDTLVEAWLRYCEPGDIGMAQKTWLNGTVGFCVERLDAIGLQHVKDIIEGCVFEDIAPLGPVGGVMQGEDVMNLANYILQNKMFTLTGWNLLIACIVTGNPFREGLTEDTLTLSDILSSGNEGLKEYVKENIAAVFTEIISKSSGQEEENGLLAIVNEEGIDESGKLSYLNKQTTCKINFLEDVDDAYKTLAIKAKVMYPSWENVIGYYSVMGDVITADLETYVNENALKLSTEKYPSNAEAGFAVDAVFGGHFEIGVYRQLLPVLMEGVSETDEGKLSDKTGKERVIALVEGKYLSENLETAAVVRGYGASIYADYLQQHISSLLSDIEGYEPGAKTLRLLLSKSSSLTNGQRWALAQRVPESLAGSDADLANTILVMMLNKKEELSWSVVEAVLKKASPNDAKMRFQEWLLKQHKDDLAKVTTVLRTMLNPYAEILNEMKRPLVPKEFQSILDAIQPLGLFTSYKEEEKGLRVYHSTK